jgi:hypothetical protein
MKVAQIMAGAPAGGAELFYERLSIALAQNGVAVLPLIRRDARRAERLRAGGLAPVELRFGGRLDLLTRPAIGRALRRFSPRVAVAWMNRAGRMTPPGDYLRPSDRQHTRHRRLDRRPGLGAVARALSAELRRRTGRRAAGPSG